MGMKKKNKEKWTFGFRRYQEPNTKARIKSLGLKNDSICIEYKSNDPFSAEKQIVLQWIN